ncbi:MAG: efflux RND transporter periplasmic adaptor subunit [Pseudomonadota bacterium]
MGKRCQSGAMTSSPPSGLLKAVGVAERFRAIFLLLLFPSERVSKQSLECLLNTVKAGLSLLLAGLLVAGCDEDEAPPQDDVVKAIKTYVVTEPAGGAQRTYSGTLTASDTSALSFPVSGTVQTVIVSQGDAVSVGEVLATLDPEPFELDVRAAEAELASAAATFEEKRADEKRQRALFQRGWVAQAALEQAVSALEGAAAQLDLARSRLSNAQRNLANATLTAPFAGRIAERSVEPFQEASAGQSLFLINADGALEVDISVADTAVSRLTAGASVAVEVPGVDDCGCTARIIEIGTVSTTANTVTVTAALLDGPPSLLPGMAVEVRIALSGGAQTKGFLVPLTAIAPGDDESPGHVFVFDQAAGIVRKVVVRSGEGVTGNLVAVRGELDAGDIIAAAGVSFLREGQRVKLLGE